MLLIETPDALEAVDNDPRAKELALACVQWLRKIALPLWLDWLESAELCMASADKADEAARFYCHALLVAIHDVVQRAPEAWGLKPLNGDIGEDVDEFEDVTISRACKESASFILLSMSIILSMLAKDLRAKYYAPEITRAKFHWKMPLNIHWGIPVKIHGESDNP